MTGNETSFLEQEFQLKRYWEMIHSRRGILFICVILAFLAGAVKAMLSTPVYEASGTLLIAPEREGVITFNDRGAITSRNTDYFNTQVKILRSRALIKKVITELSSASFQDRPVEKKEPLSQTASGTIAPLEVDETPTRIDSSINRFLSALKVSPLTDTELVEVSFSAPDPQRAAAAVNTLFKAFIEFDQELKTQSTRQTSIFITQQMSTLEKRLAQKEEELQNYSKRKDLFYLSNEQNVEVGKFADLNRAFTESQLDRINKESIYRELAGKHYEDLPAVRNNALISTLRNTYSNLEADYKQKSQVFQDSYPEMSRLKAQMEALARRIDQESRDIAEQTLKAAKTDFESAIKKENSLKELLTGQKKNMVESNSDAIHYKSLSIEVANMRDLLNYLDRKQREAILSTTDQEGSQLSNIKIIDPAEIPQTRLSPNRKMIFLMALVLGFGAGIGLILLLEFLDTSIKHREDVRRLFGVTPLGSIYSGFGAVTYQIYDYHTIDDIERKYPYPSEQSQKIEMINVTEPTSHPAECYRNIRTAILLTTYPKPPRIFTFSSARPEEGKTTTAVNLAIAFQQMGKKVLIIDGDLRKPRLHQIFNLNNQPGLISYLQNSASWEQVIQKTPIPDLFVLPAGQFLSTSTSGSGPLELLNSDQMADLIKNRVISSFDYVFIDAPPFMDISDPLVLGKLSDGIVLVIWHGKTNRSDAEKVKESMGQFNIPLLGVVLNRVKPKTSLIKDVTQLWMQRMQKRKNNKGVKP